MEEEEEEKEEGPVSTTDSARRGGRGASFPSFAFVPRTGRPLQNKDFRQGSFSALVFLGFKVVE